MRNLIMLLITMLIPVTVFSQSDDRTVIDELSQEYMKKILKVSDDYEMRMKDGKLYAVSDDTIIQFGFYESGKSVQCYTHFDESYDDISYYAINQWNLEYNMVNAQKSSDGTYTTSTIALQGGVKIAHVFFMLRNHSILTNKFEKRFGN